MASALKEGKNTLKKIGHSVGASRWKVCYQRGLPRLVLYLLESLNSVKVSGN